jgi:replicative DNA helicase
MDMKKILQALDTASTKPVEGSNDMKKFLSVVTEGKNPHKVALPVQMAMQHYQKLKKEAPVEIVESVFKTYVAVVEDDQHEQELARQQMLRQYGKRIAESVMKKAEERQLDELSTELLGDYKKAAYADAKKADSEGDYARGDKRFKGINKATNKQFANDLKKHKQLTIEELEEAIKELKK